MKSDSALGNKVPASYRPDIDGIRAIAILCVVAFHAFPGYLPGGFVGVDVFFVISGFLISGIIFEGLRKGEFSFSRFYSHRVRRIFPALIVVLVCTFAAGWFLLLPDEFKQLGKHIATGAGFVQNFAIWSEAGYFDNASALKPLLHLWSLAIEEQFYIFYPVVVVVVWRLGFNALVFVVLLAVISFSLNLRGVGTPTATFFFPQTRVWELLAGAALAYLHTFKRKALGTWVDERLFGAREGVMGTWQTRAKAFCMNAMSVVGLLLVMSVTLSVVKSEHFPGWLALLPVFGAVLMIVAGPDTWINRYVIGNWVMVFVGLISYPLYLWHWPLLSFPHIVDAQVPNERVRAGAVALSFVLAWLTYWLVERPVRFGRGTNSAMVQYGLIAGLGLVGVLGYVTFAQNGLEFRHAALVNRANKFDYPFIHTCQHATGLSPSEDRCGADSLPVPPPTIVMTGDSVSNAYSELMAEYVHVSGDGSYYQFGRGLCPMLIDYGPAYCREITGFATRYVAETPSVDTVVLPSNWPLYAKGMDWAKGLANFKGEYKETPESFYEAFARTVEYYQKLGKKVVVFLAPPSGIDPRSCTLRVVRFTEVNRCESNVWVAREIDGSYRSKVLPYLKSRGVDVFDPFRILCGNVKCTAVDGERILWADSGHMSRAGSQYLVRKGYPELRRLFAKESDGAGGLHPGPTD